MVLKDVFQKIDDNTPAFSYNSDEIYAEVFLCQGNVTIYMM